MTIEHHTTTKDIIYVNQLLHSLTATDKENASTAKSIIGVMNVRSFPAFRVENNKYMGCYICYKKRHLLKDCTSSKIWVYCKEERNQYRSLCLKQFFVNSTRNKEQLQISLVAIGELVLRQTALAEVLALR